MLLRTRDYFWPVLQDYSESEWNDIENQEADELSKIESTDWSSDIDVALHESQRIADEEESRLKTVESKATTLLLFVGALIPFLTYLEAAAFGGKFKLVPSWITLIVLALSITYLVKASLWAFKTLSVGSYYRVYSSDLVKVWNSDGKPKNSLVIKILTATRRNQEAVNAKITALKMTHAFMFRAIVALSAIVMFHILFEIWNSFGRKVLQIIQAWIF